MTATGIAMAVDGRVAVSRVRSAKADDLRGTRDRIRYVVGQVLRFAPASCLTVIEAPIIPRHNAGAVLERAWLFGLLVDQLLLRGPVVEVRTKTRAKYATGNGNADKREVLAAVRATFPDVRVLDDNVADALALAGMGARWLGAPIDGALSKKQLAAMVAVRWPIKEEQS